MSAISFTAATFLVFMTAPFFSWAFIRMRMHANPKTTTPQVRLVALCLLFASLFGAFMFLPHLLLQIRPDLFPQGMAIGYIIGHIFLFLCFIQLIRLSFVLMPWLNRYEPAGVTIGFLGLVWLTVLGWTTMVLGRHPEFVASQGITLFHANPLLFTATGIFGVIAALPPVVLTAVNGITNTAMRVRSGLMCSGVLLLITDGPFVEASRTWTSILITNSVFVLGLILLSAGVVYRIAQK